MKAAGNSRIVLSDDLASKPLLQAGERRETV